MAKGFLRHDEISSVSTVFARYILISMQPLLIPNFFNRTFHKQLKFYAFGCWWSRYEQFYNFASETFQRIAKTQFKFQRTAKFKVFEVHLAKYAIQVCFVCTLENCFEGLIVWTYTVCLNLPVDTDSLLLSNLTETIKKKKQWLCSLTSSVHFTDSTRNRPRRNTFKPVNVNFSFLKAFDAWR